MDAKGYSSIPRELCSWITFLAEALPLRSVGTFIELLIGAMLTPAGFATGVYLVVTMRNHWSSFTNGCRKGTGPGWGCLDRCQPWRAKRRLVVPSSREAALFSRRALRQRENKVGLRTRRPVIWEPSTEQQRACEVVAQCWVTRTAGAQIGCQRPSRFWGTGMSQNLSRGRRHA